MGTQRLFKTMLILVGLVLIASMWFNKSLTGSVTKEDMTYGEFRVRLDKGELTGVKISDNSAQVKVKDKKDFLYTVQLPPRDDQSLMAALAKAAMPAEKEGAKVEGTKVEFKPQFWTGPMAAFASMLLPLIFFVAFWMFIMRQSQAGAGQAMSFGKSKAKRLSDSQPKSLSPMSRAWTKPNRNCRKSSTS